MKKIIYSILTICLFASCSTSDSTGNVSRITNYPLFELIGDSEVIIPMGGEYDDEGVIATENGIEIPYNTSISGLFTGATSFNPNVADIYTFTYSATNADGFSGITSRTVIVSGNEDLNTGMAGLYKSTVTRNGILTPQYTSLEYVLIWKNTDGTYQMSDGIGGYYHYGRGYGVGYAAQGAIITVNDYSTNNFSYSPFEVGGFGGDCVMSSLTVNAANNQVTFSTDWDAGYVFAVVLDKVQF